MNKKIFIQLVLYYLLTITSKAQLNKLQPSSSSAIITKDLMSWLNYQKNYINWSSDYKSLDTAFQIIPKDAFLKLLATGKFIPIKMIANNSLIYYKLDTLSSNCDIDIINTITNKAKLEYQYFEMEGTILPKFNFIDLDSKEYNITTLKEKMLVLNCWFIHCTSCVAEMPMLNKLVNKYQHDRNIAFVSLAFDNDTQLRLFLKTTYFKYKVVPNMKNYLLNDLKIYSFPTHIIVDGSGRIIKIIDTCLSEAELFINSYIAKGFINEH